MALIVDDHADTRAMYALHLTRQGVDVVEAGDGSEALERARNVLPDIIATDIGLTDSHGVSLFQRLRDHDDTKSIPVIAVTSHAMPREIKAAYDAGCVAVLVKPCLPDALLSEIWRVLKLPEPAPPTD